LDKEEVDSQSCEGGALVKGQDRAQRGVDWVADGRDVVEEETAIVDAFMVMRRRGEDVVLFDGKGSRRGRGGEGTYRLTGGGCKHIG